MSGATIGSRLREERERMPLSQEAFASLAGASKGAQLKWEKGQSSPTAAALAAWSEAGADVAYIVTGTRRRSSLASDKLGIEAAVRAVLALMPADERLSLLLDLLAETRRA